MAAGSAPSAASAAQEVDRIRALGATYAAVEQELHDKLSAWAELDHA